MKKKKNKKNKEERMKKKKKKKKTTNLTNEPALNKEWARYEKTNIMAIR